MKLPWPKREAEFAALEEKVKAQKSVTDEDVAALTDLVHSVDFATITQGDRTLQDYFQSTFCFHSYETPQAQPLVDLYWEALNGHKSILESRASSGGFVTFDAGRAQVVTLMNAANADHPANAGSLEALKSAIKKIDPDALTSANRDDLATMVLVVAYYAPPELNKQFHAWAAAFKKGEA